MYIYIYIYIRVYKFSPPPANTEFLRISPIIGAVGCGHGGAAGGGGGGAHGGAHADVRAEAPRSRRGADCISIDGDRER